MPKNVTHGVHQSPPACPVTNCSWYRRRGDSEFGCDRLRGLADARRQPGRGLWNLDSGRHIQKSEHHHRG
eukprot:7460546-Lingulodinium_polyedra.AAC.1